MHACMQVPVKNGVVSVNLECAGRTQQDKEYAPVVGEERMKEWQGHSKSLNYKAQSTKTAPLGWRMEKMNVWDFGGV